MRGGDISGSGTVFELTPGKPWTLKLLHTFSGGSGGNDGFGPSSGVIPGGEGTLYGTTPLGGSHQQGTVFRLSAQPGGTWKETILHTFGSSLSDGDAPSGGLVRDSSGNLYGMTVNSSGNDYGTVFELSPPTGAMGLGPRAFSITLTCSTAPPQVPTRV